MLSSCPAADCQEPHHLGVAKLEPDDVSILHIIDSNYEDGNPRKLDVGLVHVIEGQ
jgi:hypothetical protein